jgi:hypothetical protein
MSLSNMTRSECRRLMYAILIVMHMSDRGMRFSSDFLCSDRDITRGTEVEIKWAEIMGTKPVGVFILLIMGITHMSSERCRSRNAESLGE